jgi:hypothetical protein
MRAQFDKELYAAGKKVHNIQQGGAGWEELFAAKKKGTFTRSMWVV